MSTAHDFTVFRRVAGDKIWELIKRSEKAERELADANAEVWRLRDEIARLRDELCIAQEDSK